MNIPEVTLTCIQDFDGTTSAIHIIGDHATNASLLIRSPDVNGETTNHFPIPYECKNNYDKVRYI